MCKLCLGTVQFGMDYGINNQLGRQPGLYETFEILDYALNNGIDTIDTASAYGDAELILGKYFRLYPEKSNIKLISKLRPNCIKTNDIKGTIEKEITDTLKRLNVSYLDGYLLHTPEYILNEEIVNSMLVMKEKGFVKNIGVSVYDTEHGFAAINTGKVDYIQLPYSIFDKRGKKTGFLKKAKEAGITIFTRSAFLQGLFMMDEDKIPGWLIESKPYLKVFNSLLDKYKINKIDALFGFVKRETDIDYLVFGVETMGQIKEDINRFNKINVPEKFYIEAESYFDNLKESIIIPSLWSNSKRTR
jgi:aryl-alcohol dehydrogenase-like predicted oxidoreductase